MNAVQRPPRSKNREIPPGTLVVPIEGRHYPMEIIREGNEIVALRAFPEEGRIVSYARHGNALDYLLRRQNEQRSQQ